MGISVHITGWPGDDPGVSAKLSLLDGFDQAVIPF
jgi:hypothetical protein